MEQSIISKIKNAPTEPGVYIFYGKRSEKPKFYPNNSNTSLYIGKAANLRNRLKSYLKVTDIKTESLNQEAIKLDYVVLRSDIEALIEESRLIKELKPKYNILWRDDKSYLYVAFTREKFPKVFITHSNLKPKTKHLKPQLIGPFTDGNALRFVMKLLRRYFPYCTCLRSHLRDCLNAQIGLCLGFCCKKDVLTRQNAAEYRRNIKMIKAILRGQSKKLLKTIKDEKEKMALEKILAHREFLTDANNNNVNDAKKAPSQNSHFNSHFLNRFHRVECYDISNLAGKEAVGAMTVLVKSEMLNGTWVADKSQWRKFKIKSAPTRDDPRMIYEVVSRRLNHPEWPYPNLMIIDGGITQLSAARKAISNSKFPMPTGRQVISKQIKVISFAKPQQKIIGWDNPPPEIKKLVEQAIYQTHNFVIRYHRQVRRKSFLGI